MTFYSKLRAEQHRIAQDLRTKLNDAQKLAEASAERAYQDHQRQLEHVQKTTEANAERSRRRMEAEIADLNAKLQRVEADLSKVDAKSTINWVVLTFLGKQKPRSRSSYCT